MKKTVLSLVLVFSAAFCIAGFLPVKPAEAATAQNMASPNSLPLIYIRGNGTVEGTALIEREGDIYTFMGDIGNADTWAHGIVVERDNAVINGAGHALRGHGDFVLFVVGDDGQLQPRADGPPSITGITVSERSNITIKNLTICGFNIGIKGENCVNIEIISNTIKSNHYCGVELGSSSYVTLINNKIEKNDNYGVITSSNFCLLFRNNITENDVAAITDVTNSVIFENQITHNRYEAIRMSGGASNIILNNNLTDNDLSINMWYSTDNLISENAISNNSRAIHIAGGANNTFCRNQIFNNSEGVSFYEAVGNTFCNNNFISNIKQVDVSTWLEKENNSLINFWDNEKVGNYWSSYNGSDLNLDGIGDTPYSFYPVYEQSVTVYCGQDNFPLMSPVEVSGGYDDLPLWAIEKLVSLGLIEDSAVQSDTLLVATIAAVSVASAVVVIVCLVVYFRRRKR